MRISQRMMHLSKQVPAEFQRSTRSLGEINKWKATEYRFFLLYCGVFVVKDILPVQLYKHFLLLSIACRILDCRNLYDRYVAHAKAYLTKFASLANEPEIYKEDALILNLHSLLHLADDIKYFNCPLTDVSAFSFENRLGKIKRFLHGGKKPLIQLCRRLQEDYLFRNEITVPKVLTILQHASKKKKSRVWQSAN